MSVCTALRTPLRSSCSWGTECGFLLRQMLTLGPGSHAAIALRWKNPVRMNGFATGCIVVSACAQTHRHTELERARSRADFAFREKGPRRRQSCGLMKADSFDLRTAVPFVPLAMAKQFKGSRTKRSVLGATNVMFEAATMKGH